MSASEIPTTYDPNQTEDKWYQFWMENGYFRSVPDEREPYTIVIPPPNVTGVLHMGHMLNNTIQDVLVRRARMLGYNACWVPGTDHASIATEAKVVRKLRDEGIKKSDLTRDEFLKHAFEWKDKHGGIILQQLKKLGASCDWDRTSFTMDPQYSKSVVDTFIDLFEKGKIYRGLRMINWDPAAKTALSDEEVIHKEVNSKLYHVKYQVAGTNDFLTIATTRPETIMGDTAICIHPDDTRFAHLHGKKAIVPIANREVPILLDDYVDMEFGTGCLKVTPAHDVNDYEIGQRHNLKAINTMDESGMLNEHAGPYNGMDRFAVRKQIVKDIDALGQLVEVKDYQNKVGYSERTDVVIESRLSLQWWVDMKELAEPALKAVMEDDVHFWPEKFKNTYRHWMENVKDWCISRQLWWGHQIPAFFYGSGENDFVVARTLEDALEKAREKSGNAALAASDLKQDEDVMDTWFSSWLWPISVFNGFYSKEEIDYYYPTNDLVTAPEIMFFWVARMIMAGFEYRGEKPFRNVYYTGIVRDDKGRKMSKSLGNSPDPVELMKQYGADGVRLGMLITAPAGNDIPFDPKLCEQGRNFSNKVWNAFRLIKGFEVADHAQPQTSALAVKWMRSKLSHSLADINDSYDKFRLSEALMSTYKLIWDDFCSSYLEAIKPEYGKPIDAQTINETISLFGDLMKLLHPFMPFLSEELWQRLEERKSKEDALIVAPWPKAGDIDERLLAEWEVVSSILSEVRNHRNAYGVSPKESLEGSIKITGHLENEFDALLQKLGNCEIAIQEDDAAGMPRLTGALTIALDEKFQAVEKEKLEKEKGRLQGFLKSVEKKLSNERFVSNAPPQVIDVERKKQADALANIESIDAKLAGMN